MRSLGIVLALAAWALAQAPLVFCVHEEAEVSTTVHMCGGHGHDHAPQDRGSDGDGLRHDTPVHVGFPDRAPASTPVLFAPHLESIAVRLLCSDSSPGTAGDVFGASASGTGTIVLLL